MVAARILKAREIQKERFNGTGIFTNSEMSGRMLEKYCPLKRECESLMEKTAPVEVGGGVMDSLGLSARAYSRILKVARTIADLEGVPGIEPEFISEAASYRFLDRIEGL